MDEEARMQRVFYTPQVQKQFDNLNRTAIRIYFVHERKFPEKKPKIKRQFWTDMCSDRDPGQG